MGYARDSFLNVEDKYLTVSTLDNYEIREIADSTNKLNMTTEVNKYAIFDSLTISDVLISHVDASREVQKFLFQAFSNQRKMFRYLKAEYDLKDELISDDEFDTIEESCILKIKKEYKNNLQDKVELLYTSFNEYAPEELEYMNNSDLANLLGVSRKKINDLQCQLNKH